MSKASKGANPMFVCENCGSGYSAMHAATMENCPRCMIRDRTFSPLSFKAFHLPDRDESRPASTNDAEERDRSASV